MTTLVDYKAGNLTSVRYAFAALGEEVRIVDTPEGLKDAGRIVFPGVGAAKSAMANLKERGLDEAICAAVARGMPFLGICLGMQILFEHSQEDGGVDLLGLLPGQVCRFPDVPGVKVPQIGWNQVNDGANYYFVHSYYAQQGAYTIGTTQYAGVSFTSAVRRDNLLAYQFHPEKSGRAGLKLLKAWLAC